MNVLDFGFGSLEAQLWQIVFLSIRCGAALMAAPMVGGMAVPAPLRILLSIVLGFFIATWVPLPPAPAMMSVAAIIAVLHEIAVPAGVLAGIAALIIALPVMVHQFKGVIEAALEHSQALIEAR